MVGAVVVGAEREGLGDLALLRVEVHIPLIFCGDVGKHLGGAQKLAVLGDVFCHGRQAHVVARVDEERQVRPLLAEVLVSGNFLVELVLDDVVHPAEHHRHVGAGLDRQPHVGLGGIGVEARVDDDGLAPVRAQLSHATARSRGRMPRGTRAPDDVSLGDAAVARGLVELRAAGVGDRRVAQAVYERHGVVARQVALRAAGLEHVARAPEVAETRRAEELRVSAAARRREQTVLAGLVAHVDERLSDGFRRLIPGNALPFVAGLLAHALHGILVAVRMVQCLHAG